MPDSSFSNSPNQFVCGSVPTITGDGIGTPAPVYHPPPSFADVRFDTIGKSPNLLSRISAPDPAKIIFRSVSPVTLLPSPVTPHDRVPLVERIQMRPSQQSSGVSHKVSDMSRIARHRHRRVTLNPPAPSSDLIPPIATLPSASESNLPLSDSQNSPLQQVQTIENGPPFSTVTETSVPDPVYPATTTNLDRPNLDTPSSSPPGSSIPDSPAALPPASLMTTTPPSPNLPFTMKLGSSQVPDVTTAEVPQKQVAQDTLSAIHARLLRANSDVFASPAHMTQVSRSPSPLVAPQNIVAGVRTQMNIEEPNAVVLHYPYPRDSYTSSGHSHRELLSSDRNMLAPASSQTPSLQSRGTYLSSLVEAMKKLQAAAAAAVQLQIDADQAFESERVEFDERRKEFEESMLAREAEYQSQLRAVQRQVDELRTREQRLVALEEESQQREETRRAREAERRAQDDQRKLEDESRRKATYEEIAHAIQLIEEAKAEKLRWQEERELFERNMTMTQVNAPPLQLPADIGPRVEKEDGMTEEEINVVDKYDQCLARIGCLSAKLQLPIGRARQLFDILQGMKETRLQAAKAERRRIADEAESQRFQVGAGKQKVPTETEQQRVQAETGRQSVQAEGVARPNEEQEGRCRDHFLEKQATQQSASVGKERILQVEATQQQVHPEQQKLQGPPDADAEYVRLRAQTLANKQQITITSENAPCLRAERSGLAVLSAVHGDSPGDTNTDMEVDESLIVETAPLPGEKGVLHRQPASKTKKIAHYPGTSGNVMLGIPSATASRPTDARTPSTPSTVTLSDAPALYKTPSFVSASTEVGRQVITDAPLYPTQLASELNSSTSPPPDDPVSAPKNIPFPATPKSQTILANQINESFSIGPRADLSPAHQDANLRYIKKNRYRMQSNSGDRHVKHHDDGLPLKMIKTEEADTLHDSKQTSNAASEGPSTRSMEIVGLVQNDDPPSPQAILNPSESRQSHDNQISTELINQTPTASSHANISEGDPSRPITGLSTTPISPDPWVMNTSVERQGWTAAPVLSHPKHSESSYHRSLEHGSRQNCQTSARTLSPQPLTRSQHRFDSPCYPDHYSPPPVLPESSRPQHLERNEPGVSHLPVRPRFATNRKRQAGSDNEDDSRDRRRPRSNHYEPERDRDSRIIQRPRYSPTTERRGGGSTSPPYSRSLGDRMKRSPTVLESRSTRIADSYRPNYTNIPDSFQRPSDPSYRIEDHAVPDEPREGGIALLERISSAPAPTTAGRVNPARGRGRGRGDSGRGRGGRGRRSLEDRIAKD